MKKPVLYTAFIIFFSAISCEVEQPWISSSFSCGVLSCNVDSFSNEEMILKLRFFILDKEKQGDLTSRDVKNNLSFSGFGLAGLITDFREIELEPEGNYSCAVLLDNIYNQINYETYDLYSTTEIFLRKFFRETGEGNLSRFAVFKNFTPPVTFYGGYFNGDARQMDLLLARVLNEYEEPVSTYSPVPLLQSMDAILDTIHKSAPAGNRNLLVIYSRNAFIKTGVNMEDVMNKAKNYGVKVSTIMDFGGEYHISYNLDDENFLYKMALETGGFVYVNNDALSGEDMYLLGPQLDNIMSGNFRCFEAICRVSPTASFTDPFLPGFFDKAELIVELQTGYDREQFKMPFGIMIK